MRWPACAIAASVSFTWAAEDILFLPTLSAWDVPEAMASLIFLSNAVLGICISPVMAAWSDRIGRRMPFLVVGSMGAAAGLAGMTLAAAGYSPVRWKVAQFFALAGLTEFCADLSLMAGRTLACDYAGSEAELEATNAAFGLSINAGRMLGLVVGSLPLEHLGLKSYANALFFIAGTGAAGSGCLALATMRDVAKPVAGRSESASGCELRIPMPVKRLLVQSVAAWTAIVCLGMYFTSVAIQGGDSWLPEWIHEPQAAMAVQSAVAIAVSSVLPTINRRFGTAQVNNLALLGYCCMLVFLPFADSSALRVLLMGLGGITCAVIDCNPFVLCELAASAEPEARNRAQLVALMDNTLNVAQVVCSTLTGLILQALGGQHRYLFQAVGGIAAIAVALTRTAHRSREKVS